MIPEEPQIRKVLEQLIAALNVEGKAEEETHQQYTQIEFQLEEIIKKLDSSALQNKLYLLRFFSDLVYYSKHLKEDKILDAKNMVYQNLFGDTESQAL